MVWLTQRSRIRFAFVAAIVLFLQAFVTAWASAATPAVPHLDAFGNPLCLAGGDQHRTAPAGDHKMLPDCCAFGCNMAATALAAPPADRGVLMRPLSRSDIILNIHLAVRVDVPDHDPGSPRAPPLTV